MSQKEKILHVEWKKITAPEFNHFLSEWAVSHISVDHLGSNEIFRVYEDYSMINGDFVIFYSTNLDEASDREK